MARALRNDRPIRAALPVLITALMIAHVSHAAESGNLASGTNAAKAARLIAAYPDHLDRLDGNTLIWKDGTGMPFDDGRTKSFEETLAAPDIEDVFTQAYPLDPPSPPAKDFDPGRVRNDAFFEKMYGDCKNGLSNLTTIAWLPKKKGGKLRVTTVNGVHEKLKSVSAELDGLPAAFDRYLLPSAGSYACRSIAGTNRRSTHSYAIAVDINAARSEYWRWTKAAKDGQIVYRNRVPIEIVRIFEKHGFIWGGRWYHFDTMHFEYRPELLPPSVMLETRP